MSLIIPTIFMSCLATIIGVLTQKVRTTAELKHQLTGRKPKPDRTAADPNGETTDSTSSLPQPEPHVVPGGSHDQEGDRASKAGERVFSTGQPPQPAERESAMPAHEDDNGRGGEVADVDVAAGSGRSGESEEVHPSPSAPSISHGGGLNSTRTRSFWSLSLTIPSDT